MTRSPLVRSQTAVTLVTAIAVFLVALHVARLDARFAETERSWQSVRAQSQREIDLLEGLSRELGYGGYIHDFKNFVLRRDPLYLEQMDAKVERFEAIVSELDGLLEREEERAALTAIRTTLARYRANEALLKQADDFRSARDLDSTVRVDDTPAAEGFRTLYVGLERRAAAADRATATNIDSARSEVRLGYLILGVLILQSLALIGVLFRLAHQRDRSEDMLRRVDALIDESPDALLVIDAEGVVRRANPKAAELLARPLEELPGMQVESFMEESRRERHVGHRESFAAAQHGTGPVLTGDFPVLRADGEIRTADVQISRHRVDDEQMFMVSLRDVTQLRELEQQARHSQRIEALGQLTAGVAHDFNNLLTTIGGNIELAADEDRTSERKEILEDARSAIQHAATLTDQLLAFGRKQALRNEVLDPSELLEGMRAVLTRTLGAEIEISVVDESIGSKVFVDRMQLSTALLNLTINSKLAMPDGGHLKLSIRNDELDHAGQPKPHVAIEIEDNGVGIAQEHQERVFEPFFTTRGPGQGSGLGLSMVHGFVNQSNGQIRLNSTPGAGTTVTLLFPQHEEEPHGESKPQNTGSTGKAPATSHKNAGERTILVVEDEDHVRRTICRTLERAGYRVLAASGPDEALEWAAREPRIDLLFSDVVLGPHSNGFELAPKILEPHPEATVLFTSGYVEEEIRSRYPIAQSSELLAKPYAPDDLLARVVEILGRVH